MKGSRAQHSKGDDIIGLLHVAVTWLKAVASPHIPLCHIRKECECKALMRPAEASTLQDGVAADHR